MAGLLSRVAWMMFGLVLGFIGLGGMLFMIARGLIRWWTGYQPPPPIPFGVRVRRWAMHVAQKWRKLRADIRKARAGAPKRKRVGDGPAEGETIDVFVPAAAGPLVVTPVSKSPLLLNQVPVLSTKSGAKKLALAEARRRTGNPDLSWKKASKLLNQWAREERELERSMTPEYAEKMQQLTEASA